MDITNRELYHLLRGFAHKLKSSNLLNESLNESDIDDSLIKYLNEATRAKKTQLNDIGGRIEFTEMEREGK